MPDFNLPNDIKTYFSDTIVANHVELAHFAYGSHTRLMKLFKTTATKDDFILYLEWPEKRYRDNDGAIEAQLQPHMGIYKAVNKEDDATQDDVIDKCYEILDDILIRMRTELFASGFIFSINDLGTIQPVYHMLIDNAFGCRVQMPMGDWVATGLKVNKWMDK